MPSCTIAGRRIGPGQPTFVIAEIGINHGGDADICAAMIEAIARAGADAVKLQTVDADESYPPGTEAYLAHKRAELSAGALERLCARAAGLGLAGFSTPGDVSDLALMVRAGMRAVKISSGQLTNVPLVRAAARTGLPLLLSTGMAYLEEVVDTVSIAREAGCTDLVVLHCTSLYPAPADSLNLRALAGIAEATGAPVGYSDHHLGGLASIAAVAAGAVAIERHFTLDTSLPGADNAVASDPDELARIVRDIRTVEAMLGSADKSPVEQERAMRPERRRFLVARRAVAAGATFSAEDIGVRRVPPGSAALHGRDYDRVLGGRAARDLAEGEPIDEAALTGPKAENHG